MGITRTDIYTDDQRDTAAVAKVLGHPARIAILQHLLKVQSCICGELVDEIGLAQATISQHLRELKQIGLLQGQVDGPSVCYCIDPEVWSEFRRKLDALLVDLDTGDANCC